MPQWGRPPGARKGKRRQEWDEQARQWEEARRFEELQTDDEDVQSSALGAGPQGKRFASDELKFTGIDMGPRPSHRRRYDFSDDSEYSEEDEDDEDSEDERVEGVLQHDLRDKEEELVENAMDRIRRAQLRGKLDVKLTKAEMDALERRTKQTGKARPSKLRAEHKASGSSGGGSSSSNRHGKLSRKASQRGLGRKEAIPRADKHARREDASPPYAPGYAPPGFIVAGPGGMPTYAPLGYFEPSTINPRASPSRSGSRSKSRSTSAHNQQKYAQPLPQYQHPYQQSRYFSVPEGAQSPIRPPSSSSRHSAGTPPNPRALPDDPDWSPRSRSSSSAQIFPTPDPFQYMTYSPPLPQMPEQYVQPRRNISGPPDAQQPTRRSERLRQNSKLPASSSDPSLSRHRSPAASSSDRSSSDSSNGVQVLVEDSPSPPPRKRSDSKSSIRSRTGTGWQRRGRR